MSRLPSLTVFDVETTGLDPRKGHRIIEIAGLRIDGGQLDETKIFTSFVNPEREIPWEAKRVNRISDMEVKSAPTIDQVLPKFLEFAGGSILVAHNAEFDIGFLEVEKEFCWGFVDLPECLCTMKLSQSVFPRGYGHNLDVLSKRLEIDLPTDRHRALPDVLVTARVLLKMLEYGGIRSLDELRQRASFRKLVK